MPRLLRKNTIRLFEASLDCLFLAGIGLAVPRREGARNSQYRAAAEIGLIGAAAEMAMSACLTETHGAEFLLADQNRYKTGGHILNDFRTLVKDPIPRAAFLTQGISDPSAHRAKLLACTGKFAVLIPMRAGGLHAGLGKPLDLVTAAAEDVSSFLRLLADSARIKPYLASIPQPVLPAHTRIVLLEDLLKQIRKRDGNESAGELLSAAFLVTPEMPDMEPDWVAALERVQVTPRENDISFLLRILSEAIPVTLVRQAETGSYLPVRVQQDNPAAVLISPHYLRTAFTQLKDQWHAEVGLSNGRLEEGRLKLPSVDLILDVFAVGLEKAGLISDSQKLPHTQSWPFIAAALEAQGTPYPYWFIAKRTENLQQLKAYLKRAANSGARNLSKRLPEVVDGIDSILRNQPLLETSELRNTMESAYNHTQQNRQQLNSAVTNNRGTERDAGFKLESDIREALENEYTLAHILTTVVSKAIGLSSPARPYWVKKIVEAMDEETDSKSILTVIRSEDLRTCWTSARKALRLIDFMSFGPSIE